MRRISFLLAGLLLVTLASSVPAVAASQTYTVTTTADAVDGTCDADCSLREAIIAANANPGADSVVLPAGTYLLTLADTDEDAAADGDLDITDDVTILGAGSGTTTIDAGGDGDVANDGDFRVIEVVTDAALGVVGVTLTGGDIPSGDPDGSNGGGIFQYEDSGTLSLDDVTVESNAAPGNGGGVYADRGSIVRVENSAFVANTATSDGGGLYHSTGSSTFRHTVFDGNSAGSDAGALFLDEETNTLAEHLTVTGNDAVGNGGGILIGNGAYGSQLICHDCTFELNTADNQGGGLYVDDYQNYVELVDAVVDRNTAGDDGGGIFLDESQLVMTRATVTDNVGKVDGGGLWVDESPATITDSRFEGNQAYDTGGGIGGENMHLTLRDSEVVDNVAFDADSPTDGATGGGISNEEDYGTILLERVRVEGNSATEGGGGMSLYETSVVIRDSQFVDNSVTASSPTRDVAGGAISEFDGQNESRVRIERSLFENNSVSGDQNAWGGAIHRDEGPTTIVDSSFVGNSASTTWTTDDSYVAAGGALFTEESTPTPYEVRRSLFQGNAATGADGAIGRGGAIYVEDNSQAVVTNSTFSDNEAATAGGVFYGMDSGRFRAVSSTFVGNTAPDGAAIHLAADTGSGPGRANVKGSLFADHGDDTCAGVAIVSDGWNIVDDATCDLDESTDQGDTTAEVAPLADNGGPTFTHALAPTSVAIDAGAEACTDLAGAFAVTTDQRGAGRPVDGDGDDDVACDVGAFELQEAVTVVASDPKADEAPGEGDDGAGRFTISRPGTTGDLRVPYTVGGSATSGKDFTALSGTVTIPDGAASVTVVVTPVADERVEGPETVVLTLTEGLGHRVGTPHRATVTIADAPAPVDVGDSVRLAGADRIETAVAVSNASYGKDGAGAVVLARSDDFPDALAGTPLAAAEDAPILLTPPDQLLPAVEDEIERVLPDGATVYLLGGTVALDPVIEARLDQLGFDTERISGTDRIRTSIAVARKLGDPETLLVTTGANFPDALSAGAAAAQVGGAVVLTTPETPHDSTSAYLSSNPAATVYAIGGPAARAYPRADGIAGADRVATSVEVARTFFTSPPAVGLAVLDNFPDALAGGVHVAAMGGPLVLTARDGVLAPVRDYLCDNAASVEAVFLYGGTGVLDSAVFEQGVTAVNGDTC